MKKIIALLFSAIALSGCTGVVVGSAPVSDSIGATSNNDHTLLTYGLPVAYYSLDVTRDKDCALSVKLGDKPVYAREENTNFSLNYHHRGFTADHLVIKTDGQGLLMAVNGKSEDKSLAILDQAFAIATQLAGGGDKSVKSFSPPPAPVGCTPFAAALMFNPIKSGGDFGIKALNAALSATRVKVDLARPIGAATLPNAIPIDASALRTACGDSLDQKNEADTHIVPDEKPCVFFRVNKTYALTVTDNMPGGNGGTKQFMLTAPDNSALYAIEMTRRPLVPFAVGLEFDHGVLTSYESDDPSEGLAILQIPADIIKSVLGLTAAQAASAATTAATVAAVAP